MAKLDLIVQALSDKSHEDAIVSALNLPGIKNILMSVAFVRTAGLKLFEAGLVKNADKVKIFLGIRNDITSYQAVCQLLEWGVEVYAVDTGARHVIFHPKLYLVSNDISATLILGSANMTTGGMQRNIEASYVVALTHTDKSDKKILKEVVDLFGNLSTRFPRHVFKVNDFGHANEIFKSGRLVDESIQIARPPGGHLDKDGKRDDLGLMPLHKVKKAAKTGKPGLPALAPPLAGPVATLHTFYEVWRSKELTERDLNIPKGKQTNKTGSIGLDKGMMEAGDHRHYFRDDVFGLLPWAPGPKNIHIVRATAWFGFVIKGVAYGDFSLQLSHNTRTDTKTYKQKNSMTSLHWGPIKSVVARKDLLGRTLTLSRNGTIPPRFLIEID